MSAAEAAESEPRPLQPPAGVASILSMPRCARPWAAPPTHGAQPRHHQAAPQWGRLKASLSLLASTESPPRSINQTPVGPQMAALPRRLAASFDSQRAGATVAAVASEARAGTGQISPSPTTFLFLPLEGRASGASWAHPLLSESRPHSRNGAEPRPKRRTLPHNKSRPASPVVACVVSSRKTTGRAARRRPFPSDRATASGGQSFGFAR